jgi:S1-C subfamily serine protease
MKFFRLPLVALILVVCSCAFVRHQESSLFEVQTMMSSTVQIKVEISVTALVENKEIPVEPMGWGGSGVIYDHLGGIISPSHALVLTANHVLEAPKVGDIEPFPLGQLRVDAVKITVISAEGTVCELTPIIIGGELDKDVAVGEAHCALGPEAPIAHKLPPVGAKVYVVGHPLSVSATMVTEGYFSGWYGKYMIASAPLAKGNSGGPVYYNGEIVGLAVRGTDYPDIALIAPLENLLTVVKQAYKH